MVILIYKKGQILRHHFKKNELDNIREICYNMGIKYYIINYEGEA
jgi:hypothetical protein